MVWKLGHEVVHSSSFRWETKVWTFGHGFKIGAWKRNREVARHSSFRREIWMWRCDREFGLFLDLLDHRARPR